jgi:hypothetical protein
MDAEKALTAAKDAVEYIAVGRHASHKDSCGACRDVKAACAAIDALARAAFEAGQEWEARADADRWEGLPCPPLPPWLPTK